MDSDEALPEHSDEVAVGCKDNEYLLEFPNFHLQPRHFQTIMKGKVEDEEENFESTTCVICWLKLDSRMGVNGTFLVHGFFMGTRIKKQELSDMEFSTLFIGSSRKPALMLVLDVQLKMWPLLQLSQLIRAIPSSRFISHQQPNGEFGEMMNSEVTKEDAPLTLPGSTSGKGVQTSISGRPPPLPMQPPLHPPPPPQPAPPLPQAPAAEMNIELTQVRGGHINENLTEVPLNSESEITEEDPSPGFSPRQPDDEPLLDDESTEEVGCCAERFNCCCPILNHLLSFCSSMFQRATFSR